jgi:hypothetical protein
MRVTSISTKGLQQSRAGRSVEDASADRRNDMRRSRDPVVGLAPLIVSWERNSVGSESDARPPGCEEEDGRPACRSAPARESGGQASESSYWIGRVVAPGAGGTAITASVGAAPPPARMFSHTVPTVFTANARLPVTPGFAATAVA